MKNYEGVSPVSDDEKISEREKKIQKEIQDRILAPGYFRVSREAGRKAVELAMELLKKGHPEMEDLNKISNEIQTMIFDSLCDLSSINAEERRTVFEAHKCGLI
jgi:hypothetical protein